jgi:hypothetical protein
MTMTLMLRLHAIDETGAPVAGALVRTDDDKVATTDADGVALVSGIDTGFAMVTVSHSMPAEAQLVFSLGEGSTGILDRTVTLRRGAPISGTVIAPDGSPVPDAIVEVWSATGTRYVEADADGNWCVPAMLAGSYEVRAGAPGHARGRAIRGVHDGKTEQHGIVVRVATGARLYGRVRDVAGVPVASVRVYTELQPGDDSSTITDADGRFEILGLGAGRHYVTVAQGLWTSGVVVPGDGGQLELDVELPAPSPSPEPAPAASAREGTSRLAAPAALTGRVLRDGAPVSQFVIVRKGLAAYRWITQPAIINAVDGRFELTGLREPSCTVHVLALGSEWASTDTLVLQPGVTLDLGDIVLPPGLRIAGTVCNPIGDSVAGARVEIGSPRHEDDALIDAVEGNFATTSGSDGSFAFDGIHLRGPRAGLSACHPMHGASLEQLLTASDETVRLVLLPTGSIDGEIEPYSQMCGGLIVRSHAPGGGGRVASVRPSGFFQVENLVPGEYTIEVVERPRWPRREVRVTVVAGQRTHVRMPPP